MGEAINLVNNFKVEKVIFNCGKFNELEKDLLEQYNLQDIDVLKIGHHGSRTSSSKEFIDEINPRYSIISVGKNNRYGYPNNSVLENLENSKIYRTDQDGSIMFKIKRSELSVDTCAPKLQNVLKYDILFLE